jgi:nitroreductase
MEVLEAIHTRRSIRKFEDKTIPPEILKKIVNAAMAAPSAGNSQPWEFIVLTEKKVLAQVPAINPYAQMAVGAPAAVLVCGKLEVEKFPGYWVVDCSAATQNMLLAAHSLGLGAVWTGIYPQQDRMDGFARLLGLPDRITAHSLVVMGYPAQSLPAQDRFRLDRVHCNRW